MNFLWSLSDCESPQVSRTLLNIQVDLNNGVVWIIIIIIIDIIDVVVIVIILLLISFSNQFQLVVFHWVWVTASLHSSPVLFWLSKPISTALSSV